MLQAMREIVHRAQSDNAKGAVRANQPVSDFMDSAIATCGDDHVCLLCCRLCRQVPEATFMISTARIL